MSERTAPPPPDPTGGRALPVTAVIRRRVRPGREADYERWLERLTAAAAERFPGYLGADIQRPASGSSTYTSVVRFGSVEQLRAFEGSELRADALREVADLVEADAVWERYSGLEVWFEAPPGATVPQPSRLRMALLLTAVVYLLVLGIGSLAARLLGDLLPGPLRLLLVIAVEVALMTWLIMPALTRRLARWIYPTSRRVAAADGGV